MSNTERADKAYDAIRKFTDFGLEEASDDLETYVGDMLANILHLCNRDGLNFNLALRRAQMHFNEEVR